MIANKSGVIQRTIDKIINSNRSNNYGFAFKMKVFEIYMNQYKDLLAAEETFIKIIGKLQLENKIKQAASVEIENLDQIMDTYNKVVKKLQIYRTLLNKESSRSHLIVSIEFQHPVKGDTKLLIVDLAGLKDQLVFVVIQLLPRKETILTKI